MKGIFKISTVLALMFMTATSMANDPKISLAPGNDAKSIIVELDEQANESTLRMTDAYNNPLFFENINENRYAKKFNLKDLGTGIYYFTIQNPVQSVVFTLNVEDLGVEIINREENHPIPVFRKVGDKIYLNLLNQDLKNVDIKIVNGQDDNVFKESVSGDLIIGKVFNFEKAVSDRYTVIVRDGGHTYSTSIVVR